MDEADILRDVKWRVALMSTSDWRKKENTTYLNENKTLRNLQNQLVE
jgi:hypothetical protein